MERVIRVDQRDQACESCCRGMNSESQAMAADVLLPTPNSSVACAAVVAREYKAVGIASLSRHSLLSPSSSILSPLSCRAHDHVAGGTKRVAEDQLDSLAKRREHHEEKHRVHVREL